MPEIDDRPGKLATFMNTVNIIPHNNFIDEVGVNLRCPGQWVEPRCDQPIKLDLAGAGVPTLRKVITLLQ